LNKHKKKKKKRDLIQGRLRTFVQRLKTPKTKKIKHNKRANTHRNRSNNRSMNGLSFRQKMKYFEEISRNKEEKKANRAKIS